MIDTNDWINSVNTWIDFLGYLCLNLKFTLPNYINKVSWLSLNIHRLVSCELDFIQMVIEFNYCVFWIILKTFQIHHEFNILIQSLLFNFLYCFFEKIMVNCADFCICFCFNIRSHFVILLGFTKHFVVLVN